MGLKYKIPVLLIIMIIGVSLSIIAEEKPVIKEIIIIGPTRSEESIILKQLPFREGDYWEEGYKELAYRRVEVLNIFNPMELKVITEPVDEKFIRVVIRATDTGVFYVDPVELVVMKTVALIEQQFNQEIRSPLGKGVNYSLGIGWGSNPWWKVGFSYPLSNGFSLKWQHNDFDMSARFNGDTYHQDGFNESLYIKQVFSENWEFGYGIGYRNNGYQLEGEDRSTQKYLTGMIETIWKGYGQLQVSIHRGQSLEEEQPDFNKVMIDYLKEYQIEGGELIFRLQSGLADPETPLNLQFHGGGFSSIPLRGYSFNLAGDRFVRGVLEYHRRLPVPGLSGIVFIDYGKILPAERSFKEESWLVSGGLGLAYDTPLDLPVRCDLAFNPEGEYNWKLGFGDSF